MGEDKCKVFSPVGIQNWDLNIPIKQDGLIILGSPCSRIHNICNRIRVQTSETNCVCALVALHEKPSETRGICPGLEVGRDLEVRRRVSFSLQRAKSIDCHGSRSVT